MNALIIINSIFIGFVITALFFFSMRKLYGAVSKLRSKIFKLETELADANRQVDELTEELIIIRTALLECEVITEDTLYDVERRIIEIPHAQSLTGKQPEEFAAADAQEEEDDAVKPPYSRNIH